MEKLNITVEELAEYILLRNRNSASHIDTLEARRIAAKMIAAEDLYDNLRFRVDNCMKCAGRAIGKCCDCEDSEAALAPAEARKN